MYRPQNLRIPGPTFVPQAVLAASARPLINHRGPEFAALLAALTRALQDFRRTEHDVLLLTASGSGGMEAAIANTLSSGDKALVFSCGAFGERFAAIAKSYGVDARRVDVPYGRAVDPELVRDELAKEKGKDSAKAILVTHNETSTGVLNPLKDIAGVVRDSGKLFLVDRVPAARSCGRAKSHPDPARRSRHDRRGWPGQDGGTARPRRAPRVRDAAGHRQLLQRARAHPARSQPAGRAGRRDQRHAARVRRGRISAGGTARRTRRGAAAGRRGRHSSLDSAASSTSRTLSPKRVSRCSARAVRSGRPPA